MWRGGKSLRWIWARIKNLPPSSAMGRKVDPDQWRNEHQILADVYDLLLAVNTDGSKERPWYPTPARQAEQEAKQKALDERILAARDRLRKQLAAGGDFDA